jgi:hypothetical protein
VSRGLILGAPESLYRPLANMCRLDTQRGEYGPGRSVLGSQCAEQKMVGAEVVLFERPRLALREDDRAAS